MSDTSTPEGNNGISLDSNNANQRPEALNTFSLRSRILSNSQRQIEGMANHYKAIEYKIKGNSAYWENRESKFLKRIENSIEWYRHHSGINRIFHLLSSAIILTGGVLAPLFIASSESGDGWDFAKIFSALLAVLMGLAEGSRRIFHFHDKWRSFYISMTELIRIREAYRDLSAGIDYGSPEWVKYYLDLREDYFDLTSSETNNYFTHQSGNSGKANTQNTEGDN